MIFLCSLLGMGTVEVKMEEAMGKMGRKWRA
jgi:hypothetical protein